MTVEGLEAVTEALRKPFCYLYTYMLAMTIKTLVANASLFLKGHAAVWYSLGHPTSLSVEC